MDSEPDDHEGLLGEPNEPPGVELLLGEPNETAGFELLLGELIALILLLIYCLLVLQYI